VEGGEGSGRCVVGAKRVVRAAGGADGAKRVVRQREVQRARGGCDKGREGGRGCRGCVEGAERCGLQKMIGYLRKIKKRRPRPSRVTVVRVIT
jgi:hypothetical protein